MQFGNLGVVERKVLGALMIMANDEKTATTSMSNLARVIGYKRTGGILTYAIKILERDNFIVKEGNMKYKLLI